MDGLCGGIAFIASIFLFFTSQAGHFFLLFLAISLFAFLIFNFPPAKIFMGDAGSLSLGFLLASYSILGSYGANNRLALISPILILWLPIYETILVSVMRIKKGKSPFMGSKDHFAFRLRKLKFPKLAILLISYFITIIMGETAFLAAYMDLENAILVYFLLVFFFIVFFYLLSLIKVENFNDY
jgi:UDP-GlcNAc:undecaprenyl-phosphate GlcNAc-1-phosphate transferase